MMRNRVDMEGNIMAAIIGSPTRYIQGKGEMKNLDERDIKDPDNTGI